MKTKIFLTGPLRNLSAAQCDEFYKASKFLAQNYNAVVISIVDYYDGIDPTAETFNQLNSEILKKRVADLTTCTRLVHLSDYEQDCNASNEVRIAKSLDIRINGITSMTKTELQNENGNTTTNASTGSDTGN